MGVTAAVSDDRPTFPLASRIRRSVSTVTPSLIECTSRTSRTSRTRRTARAQHLLPTLSPFPVNLYGGWNGWYAWYEAGCGHDDSGRAAFSLATRSRHSASTLTPATVSVCQPYQPYQPFHLRSTPPTHSLSFSARLYLVVGMGGTAGTYSTSDSEWM